MASTAYDHHRQDDAGSSIFASNSNKIIEAWKKRPYLNWTYEGLEGALSIHDFLHYVTTTVDADSNNAWFKDDQMDVALTSLTKESVLSPSVFLVPTLYGQILCSIGSARLSPEILGDYPIAFLDGLNNPEKRWIVVPCSDGMLATHEGLQEAQQAREAVRKKQKSKPLRTSQTSKNTTGTIESVYLGEGAHWGLLVVDKERKDARFIDGYLELKRRRGGGHKIDTMLPAGRAAGKILCAIEAILDSTSSGQFATGTLKYVPHQHDNDFYSGDHGSGCGPYVYAMLEYAFKHETQMLQDLEGTFSERQRPQHATGLNFNSWQTRRDIRDRVHNSKIELEDDPLKALELDPSIMDILGLISPDAVLEKLNSYNARFHSLGGALGPQIHGSNDPDSYTHNGDDGPSDADF